MLVLVSTFKTQGYRRGDFNYVPTNEIVKMGSVCDSHGGECGCDRSMVGIFCLKATTTMEVVDIPNLTVEHLADLLRYSDDIAGFNSFPDLERAQASYLEEAEAMAEYARIFGLGSVIEIKGNRMRDRLIDADKDAKLRKTAAYKKAAEAHLRLPNSFQDLIDRAADGRNQARQALKAHLN